MINISPDGPNNLTITREDEYKEEHIYNICPNRTNINFTCATNDVFPSAHINMTSSPEDLSIVDCPEETDSCEFSYFPNVTGEHIFNCTGINTVFDFLTDEDQFNITVQGN